MKRLLPCSLSVLLLATLGFVHAEPNVVDDLEISRLLNKKLGKLVDAGGVPTAKELVEQLSRKNTQVQLPKVSTTKLSNVYEPRLKSVVAISSIYKCDKCDDWHQSGGATAWVLTSDGIMVTNHHVFAGKDVAGFGIWTHDGKVAPVMEILAASEVNDIAIFRVKGSGFTPVALGSDADVGSPIHIIAHPDSRFYTYTAGNVSRYYKKKSGFRKGAVSMVVTAEFAHGSSGGPVMDDFGNVVGMVASTRTLYATPKDKKDSVGHFQMVVRNCVTASQIRALFQPAKE